MEKKKSKQTEAKKKYDKEYRKNHLRQVLLTMQKSDYDKLLDAAKQSNIAVNTFIKQAISEKINTVGSDPQPQSKEWYGYSIFNQANPQPKQDQQNQQETQATQETDEEEYKLPWETD